MIEWGIYKLVNEPAGMFLAEHYSTLGPYFGDKSGHDWPQNPFQNNPTQLELAFNQHMEQITEKMSNGRLKNVSILDLPAFGSSIPLLQKHHKIEPNWPIEVNFEILKGIQKNAIDMFIRVITVFKDLVS